MRFWFPSSCAAQTYRFYRLARMPIRPYLVSGNLGVRAGGGREERDQLVAGGIGAGIPWEGDGSGALEAGSSAGGGDGMDGMEGMGGWW